MVKLTLRDALIEILIEHVACIAHEINDRIYSRYGIPFTSFRNLREVRNQLILEDIIEMVPMESPYSRPYEFYYLRATNGSNIDQVVEKKHSLLLEYSHYRKEVGHFLEDLVADAVSKLGFIDIEVRKSLGKKDVDVWCRDPDKKFYWAIECKNRRQEINKNDLDDVLFKTKKASSMWNVKSVKPALISSSVYYRLPDTSNFPIIPTGRIYVPNRSFYRQYKRLLGSWYLEPVNSLPNDLVDLIDELLK